MGFPRGKKIGEKFYGGWRAVVSCRNLEGRGAAAGAAGAAAGRCCCEVSLVLLVAGRPASARRLVTRHRVANLFMMID